MSKSGSSRSSTKSRETSAHYFYVKSNLFHVTVDQKLKWWIEQQDKWGDQSYC